MVSFVAPGHSFVIAQKYLIFDFLVCFDDFSRFFMFFLGFSLIFDDFH